MCLLRIIILACLGLPFLGFSELKTVRSNCVSSVTESEIYSIVNEVIRQRGIDKKSRLNVQIANNLNFDLEDNVYLKDLLKDSTRKSEVYIYDSLGHLESIRRFKDRNLLNESDLTYMKCVKKQFRKMKWDNAKIGFEELDSSRVYTFSLPYFNLKHNLVLIRYNYYCGSLCGEGVVLVLKRKDDGWNIDWLEMYVS
jgi:hypothetical protein